MEIIQKDWDEAQQWRDSAIKGVEFKLDNPDAHDAQCLMADKIIRLGVWRRKDEMLKTHHCIVAFENCRNSNKKMHYLLTL
jgi:hypothetical protein